MKMELHRTEDPGVIQESRVLLKQRLRDEALVGDCPRLLKEQSKQMTQAAFGKMKAEY